MMRLLHGLAALLGAILAVVIGLACLALSAFLLLFDVDSQRPWLAESASGLLGRDVTIDGPLGVRWGWTPHVTIEGMTVANTEWGKAPHLARIERLDVEIDLWQLLRGRTVLPLIKVSSPDLFLQQRESGETNWSFGPEPVPGQDREGVTEQAAEEATIPDDRTEVPVIKRMVIDNGQFAFVDLAMGLQLDGKVSTAVGDGSGEDEIEVEGRGEVEQEPFDLKLHAGSFAKLRDENQPFPLNLEVRLGDTAATVEGTITRPLNLTGLDLELSIKGPSLDKIFPLTGIPLPPTPPYQLSGSLFHREDIWRLQNLDGRLGDSDLRGVFEVDVGADPLTFDADLVSDRLDIRDLGGFVGAPVEEEQEVQKGIIPDRDIDLERLNAANGHARLKATSVITGKDLPLDDVDAELILENGVARLQPISFGVASGSIDLWLSLYGDKSPAQIDALARVRGLHLKDAFKGSDFAQETGGQIDGRIELSGSGNSLQKMLASASGHSFLVLADGKMSGLLLELLGLDAAEALGLYLGEGDTPVEIRCVATEFDIENGLAETKLAVLDTADTLVQADGRADLGKETLEFSLAPHPHDVSLFNLRSKIEINGTFEQPEVNLDAASILEYLPPIDLGTAEAVPCKDLIEQARRDDG